LPLRALVPVALVEELNRSAVVVMVYGRVRRSEPGGTRGLAARPAWVRSCSVRISGEVREQPGRESCTTKPPGGDQAASAQDMVYMRPAPWSHLQPAPWLLSS